jgi:putative ABC transport system permease protein
MSSRSRLRASDLAGLAGLGLRTRTMRAALSALGICIGIAAIVGVVGITQSSESSLLGQIDRLGTNLLTVQNGRSFNGTEATLPLSATAMIGHMPAVQHVSATALLAPAVYRSNVVPTFETGGIGARATDVSLLRTLDGSLLQGSFLNAATSRYPVAVLGFGAAQYLGIARLDAPTLVWIEHRSFVVIGILGRLPLAPEIDQSVLVGWPIAESALGFNGFPTRIYVRAVTDQVVEVDSLLAPTADPQNPEQVAVSRPSDALAARLAVQSSSTNLILGVGAIALLVGGVGIANVMFVSVLERRTEIGLRRALGATRRHIAMQFLAESLLLSSIGGIVGVLSGVAATVFYAGIQGWAVLIPVAGVLAALMAAVVVGGAAGIYPAVRAAGMSPTDALRST